MENTLRTHGSINSLSTSSQKDTPKVEFWVDGALPGENITDISIERDWINFFAYPAHLRAKKVAGPALNIPICFLTFTGFTNIKIFLCYCIQIPSFENGSLEICIYSRHLLQNKLKFLNWSWKWSSLFLAAIRKKYCTRRSLPPNANLSLFAVRPFISEPALAAVIAPSTPAAFTVTLKKSSGPDEAKIRIINGLSVRCEATWSVGLRGLAHAEAWEPARMGIALRDRAAYGTGFGQVGGTGNGHEGCSKMRQKGESEEARPKSTRRNHRVRSETKVWQFI